MDPQAELQKLQDIQQFISEHEYETRLQALQAKFPHLSTGSKQANLDSIIVCFFCDGSQKYTHMTTHSVSTFLKHTPKIKVGILHHAHDNQVRNTMLNAIPSEHHHRIIWKHVQSVPHFQNWNPTQYKLDIQQFTVSGEFSTIFWFDSDTITVADVTPFLLKFANSPHLFYFVADHAMADQEFCNRWKQQRPLLLVPQACIMGFKSSVVADFFGTWKGVWRDWIEPHPFARYPDPRPHFSGSAFCIEQYALGMALESFLRVRELNVEGTVLVFDRTLLAVLTNGPDGQTTDTNNNNNTNPSSQNVFTKFLKLIKGENTGTSGDSTQQSLSIPTSFWGALEQTSMSMDYARLEEAMKALGASNISIPLSASNLSYPLQNISFAFANISFAGSLENISFANTSFPFENISFTSASYPFASLFANISNALTSESGSYSFSLGSIPIFSQLIFDGVNYSLSDIPPNPFEKEYDRGAVVDSFGGGILHCYNHNYDVLYNWSKELKKQ